MMSFSRALLVAGLLGLAGCGSSSDFDDLRSYMDEVRAKPKGAIEPLPTFQPYESFTYRAASLRSPFQPPVKIDIVARQKGSADGVIAAAEAAISAARSSLDGAPAGKGTEADIEQLRADLSGADADLGAARSAVSSENFADAETKAKSADHKAGQVANGVQMATQKYNDMVEKMRPWYDRI